MLGKLRALRSLPVPIRLLVTGAAAALTCAFQLPLEPDVPGDPFLLFFMVVIGAAFAFGEHIGFVAVGLTTFLAFFFFEPFGTLAIKHAGDLIKIELYAVLTGISVLIVASIGRALVDAKASAEMDGEGNIFVRELTHRIANNLAVVAALIRRKAGSVTDVQARSVLDEAIEQVTIMARLHRHLQVGGEAVSVDSEHFIGDLCDDLQTSMARDRPISIEHMGMRRALPVAQAVPLGLIVNELVTNALKHAFPGNRRGRVRVRLQQETDNSLLLVVEDDGVGMRPLAPPSGMGRSLLHVLAAQLSGRLECRSDDRGTTFTLLFPTAPFRSPPGTSHVSATTT
jgi:two-component sensor histidine kinase